MKRLAIGLTLLIMLMVFVPASAAEAAPALDRIIKAGDTVYEDLVIFGGRLVIEKGARVEGNVSVFGGSATLDGDIKGDVSIFGGTTDLTGTIEGDLVIFGGNLNTGDTADIDGECVLVGGTLSGDGAGNLNCPTFGELPGLSIPALTRLPAIPRINPPDAPRYSAPSIVSTISSAAATSLVLGVLALVAASVVPGQVNQVTETLRRKPAASGVVGILTAIAVPSLMGLLAILFFILSFVCIGLLGWPVLLVMGVALSAAVVMGWIAAGTILGRWLARVMNLANRSPLLTAFLGTVVLTLMASLLSELPFFLGGWLWFLAALLVTCAGLGAVALTRFGTRSYPLLLNSAGGKTEAVLETLIVEDRPAEKSPGKNR